MSEAKERSQPIARDTTEYKQYKNPATKRKTNKKTINMKKLVILIAIALMGSATVYAQKCKTKTVSETCPNVL